MQNWLRRMIMIIQQMVGWGKQIRRRVNEQMRSRYSPRRLALMVTILCGALILAALFLPPYLGVANDGTVAQTMNLAGLSYLDSSTESSYNNYFVRVYQNVYPAEGTLTAHILLLKIARAIDYYLTRDTLFDVRVLGMLYTLLYLPGVYLVTRSALERLRYFTENMVVSAAAVLIFADISYISYFNSLYPEPLLLIGLLYLVGGAMMLQKKSKLELPLLLMMGASTLLLCFTRKHCFMTGLWAAIFFCLFLRTAQIPRGLPLMLAAGMLAGMLTGIAGMPEDFTDTSRIHAMTRGVLLQANDPEKALKEFGIDGSYALLADVSMYDQLPLSEEENSLLHEGFLDQYNSMDVGLYYLRHPGAMVSMLDLGIKASFDLRRTYCGNYEQSAGMPKRAQSTFWSMYSTYKIRSAPKTVGYLVILIAAFLAMSGRKTLDVRGKPDRFHYIYLLTMLLITLIGVGNILYIILNSGDAQLSQYNFMMGVCMDLLLFYVLAEILNKLNILEQGKEGKTR